MYLDTWFPLAPEIDEAIHYFYGDMPIEETLERFASHWGGLDLDHFRLAIAQGEGEEQVLALGVLDRSGSPDATALLLPFLSQGPRRQRWMSALCLGMRHDTRAFPALEALLLDGLTEEDYARAWEEEQYLSYALREELTECNSKRWKVVKLLTPWESPSIVATLKQTFVTLWQRQQQYPHLHHDHSASYDAIACELGRRGDFSLEFPDDFPDPHRRLAQLALALGWLGVEPAPQKRGDLTSPSRIFQSIAIDPVLRKQAATVLGSQCGLALAEQMAIVDHIWNNQHLRDIFNGDVMVVSEEDEEVIEEEVTEEEEDEEATEIRILHQWMFEEQTGRIQSLAWSPDGSHLVAGSEDGTVCVWNAMTGKRLTTFEGHRGSVNLVAWSPDGLSIASGGSDRLVSIWDARTGKPLQRYQGHQSWIWGGLAWSPDGTKLVSASLDQTIQIWDTRSGQRLLTYEGHTSMITSLAWSPDGDRIVSAEGYPRCRIHLWDAASGTLQLEYHDHEQDDHRSMPPHIVKDGGGPGDIAWWREAAGVSGPAWSPDGRWIASASRGRDVCRVWDARTGENRLALYRWDAAPLQWSPDSVWLLSQKERLYLTIWHGQTNRTFLSRRIADGLSLNGKALSWSPDGTFMAAGAFRLNPSYPFGQPVVLVWKTPPEVLSLLA